MDNPDTPHQDQNNQYGTLSQTSTRNTCYNIPENTLESTSPTHNASGASNFLYSQLPLTPPDSDLNQGKSPSPPADTSRNRFIPNMTSTPSNGVIVKQEVPSPVRANFGEEPSTAGQNWSPRSSPDSRSSNDLENLQEIVQRNTMSASVRHSSQSNNVTLRNYSKMEQPKVTSSGKVKTYKCKNCSHISMTKVEFWEHSRIHMKPDKILSCRQCPFITEFKHHLEYHILNHNGKKPFKCKECDYQCVNKSMLSSHAKSHSDVYQYRCMDCNYAAKYLHSLKQHLKKYEHRPSKVLNPDGTVNPHSVIDIHGTRRGPKIKQPSQQPQQNPNQQDQQLNQPPLPSNLVPPVTYMQPPFMIPPPEHFLQFGLPGAIPHPLLLQNIHRLVQEQQAKTVVEALLAKQAQESPEMETDAEVLDLSKPGPAPDTTRNRRKGLAHKIDNSNPDESSNDDDDENATTTMFSNVEVVQNEEDNSRESSNSAHQEAATQDAGSDSNNNTRNEYRCDHCGITFSDGILHTIHMGFHGFNDPFACNVCGKRCNDKLEFYTHILRPRHQRDDA